MPQHDVLIIGSGLAAATLALSLPASMKVALVTKKAPEDSSSFWAQGGIAAVMGADDSFDDHVRDTLVAGAGLCDEAAVRRVVEAAPDAVRWLIDQGAPFDLEGEAYHLAREGGHSRRRVLHAADATGRAVQQTLLARLAERPNITLLSQHIAVDLITDRRLGRDGHSVYGAYVLDNASGRVRTFQAGATVLATGGAGKAFLYTTNPDTATGDGIAMAWRAGCRVANLEFIQFHPTCLYHPHAKSFLITEAMRGEGAVLRLPDGSRFMPEHDERAELAPRDVVARAIDFEMKKRGLDASTWTSPTSRPASSSAISPPSTPAAWNWASTSRGNGFRWRPPPTTPAAACWWTATARPTRTGFMWWARPPARVCMAPTAWPAIPCWSAWYTAARRRPISPAWKPARRKGCRIGTKAG
jgi:L-aspartate oxidase